MKLNGERDQNSLITVFHDLIKYVPLKISLQSFKIEDVYWWIVYNIRNEENSFLLQAQNG